MLSIFFLYIPFSKAKSIPSIEHLKGLTHNYIYTAGELPRLLLQQHPSQLDINNYFVHYVKQCTLFNTFSYKSHYSISYKR